jgi:hypothetical protein
MFVIPVWLGVPGFPVRFDAQPAKKHSIRVIMILSAGDSRAEYVAQAASI